MKELEIPPPATPTGRWPSRTAHFVDSVEQVGGYYDVELPDLDSAIAAGRLLRASYAVEIRPAETVEGFDSRCGDRSLLQRPTTPSMRRLARTTS